MGLRERVELGGGREPSLQYGHRFGQLLDPAGLDLPQALLGLSQPRGLEDHRDLPCHTLAQPGWHFGPDVAL